MNAKPLPLPAISAEKFPALRAFLRGYFHEDMKEEYGSLEEAVQQFREDADSGEWKTTAGEWKKFLEQTRGRSLAAMNRLLTQLGSAGVFRTAEELEAVNSVFLSGLRR